MLAPVIALTISLVFTWRLSRPNAWLRVLDRPNERSLHSTPIPRTGGIAILSGCVAGTLFIDIPVQQGTAFLALGMGSVLVGAISFLDDRRGIPIGTRLAFQTAAALLLVVAGLIPPAFDLPGRAWAWSQPVAAVIGTGFILWMINLYNFMDGMDGFAGGMAVIGFGTFAVLGWVAGEPVFATVSVVIAAAVAGFLVFNFPPAHIFMGDTGSATLGFLAGALALWAARDGIFPIWVGLLVFSPFVVDATVTLLRRVARRDKIWLAHKTHYYQRLVQLGWGHKKTVVREYVLMFLCALTAVLVVRQPPTVQWGIIMFWLAIYATLALLVEQMDRRAGITGTAK